MTTPIQSNDPLLSDMQANILTGHGRSFAHHIFFQFIPGQTDLARNWIAGFATSTITTAQQHLQGKADYKSYKTTDAGPILTLSLAASGFDRLSLSALKPSGNSFQQGMRAGAADLGDDPDRFEEGYTGIDMMIMVASDCPYTAGKIAAAIIEQTAPFAITLRNQRGNVLKTAGGTGLEHFGYADGISQPLYLADDIDKQPTTDHWNDATDTSLLLVKETLEDGKDHFGSFLVFRKLEQNVLAFKNAEGDNEGVPGVLPIVKNVDGKDNKELAGAMLVGRFENGTPVTLSSEAVVDNPSVHTNDFSYEDDKAASKCPYHAHIRLMNPRKGDDLIGDVSEHRITRRGIPYDEVGRIPEAKIHEVSGDLLDANQPEEGVGLLFMCYQSDIDDQFRVLQQFWANQGQIQGPNGTHSIGAQDSIIGQGTNPPKTLPQQWGSALQSATFDFSGFVTMKGGEYLYTPSISLLTGLSATSTTPSR